ncbi:MAG: DUF1624 domain-containing protein, partial [Candidatus Kapabacteria bacterium]|nr:DUF1624 domain-containing protein [Candidatus Kapabacteria bacterium]
MTNTVVTSQPKQRLNFIDYLRGIAVLWMIEVHVVDICLATTLKDGWFYNVINISNGFVSVCFITCAGAGFALAADRKANEYRAFQPALWQYLKRLSHILLLAFWLHLPAFSLQRTLQSSYQEWLRLLECDVLHTIVYSSIAALVLLMLIKNTTIRTSIYALLAAVFFFATPFVWQWDSFQSLPMFFATWFAKQPISKFPVFPFAGYFFAGAALTGFFLQTPDKTLFAKRGA